MNITDRAPSGFYLVKDFLRNRWRMALLVFSLDLAANFLVIALSLFLAQAIALIFSFKSVRSSVLGLQSDHALEFIGAAIAIKFILDYCRHRYRNVLSEDLVFALRQKAFTHHLLLSTEYHELHNSSRQLLRFTGDMGSVQRLLHRGILQFIADALLIVMGASFIFAQDWRLGVLVGGMIAVSIIINFYINRNLKTIEARRRSKKADMVNVLNITLSNLSGIQALNRQKRVASYFITINEKVRLVSSQYFKLAAIAESMPLSIVHLLVFAALVIGWKSAWPADRLFAAVMVLMSWRSALSRILKAGLVWEKGILSLEKMHQLLQRPTLEEGSLRIEKNKPSSLELDRIAYPLGGQQQLGPITLHLQPGQVVCLTGGMGSGKTTLLKLIAGLYRPQSGEIRWNGTPALALAKHSIRLQVSYTSSVFPLFGKRLSDALSNSNRPEQLKNIETLFRSWQALFPALMPLEFHQKMINLSTGQLQLLQIFRAISTQKPFLVLDEPFVGLDGVTIRQLAERLYELKATTGILILTAQPELLSSTVLHEAIIMPIDQAQD